MTKPTKPNNYAPKDIAPSNELRKWYSYDPSKWLEFKKRYWKEIDSKREAIGQLSKESKKEKIPFVYGSKEEKLNNAVALKEYIDSNC